MTGPKENCNSKKETEIDVEEDSNWKNVEEWGKSSFLDEDGDEEEEEEEELKNVKTIDDFLEMNRNNQNVQMNEEEWCDCNETSTVETHPHRVYGQVEYPYKTAAERTAVRFSNKPKDGNERYLDWIKTIKEEGEVAADESSGQFTRRRVAYEEYFPFDGKDEFGLPWSHVRNKFRRPKKAVAQDLTANKSDEDKNDNNKNDDDDNDNNDNESWTLLNVASDGAKGGEWRNGQNGQNASKELRKKMWSQAMTFIQKGNENRLKNEEKSKKLREIQVQNATKGKLKKDCSSNMGISLSVPVKRESVGQDEHQGEEQTDRRSVKQQRKENTVVGVTSRISANASQNAFQKKEVQPTQAEVNKTKTKSSEIEIMDLNAMENYMKDFYRKMKEKQKRRAFDISSGFIYRDIKQEMKEYERNKSRVSSAAPFDPDLFAMNLLTFPAHADLKRELTSKTEEEKKSKERRPSSTSSGVKLRSRFFDPDFDDNMDVLGSGDNLNVNQSHSTAIQTKRKVSRKSVSFRLSLSSPSGSRRRRKEGDKEKEEVGDESDNMKRGKRNPFVLTNRRKIDGENEVVWIRDFAASIRRHSSNDSNEGKLVRFKRNLKKSFKKASEKSKREKNKMKTTTKDPMDELCEVSPSPTPAPISALPEKIIQANESRRSIKKGAKHRKKNGTKKISWRQFSKLMNNMDTMHAKITAETPHNSGQSLDMQDSISPDGSMNGDHLCTESFDNERQGKIYFNNDNENNEDLKTISEAPSMASVDSDAESDAGSDADSDAGSAAGSGAGSDAGSVASVTVPVQAEQSDRNFNAWIDKLTVQYNLGAYNKRRNPAWEVQVFDKDPKETDVEIQAYKSFLTEFAQNYREDQIKDPMPTPKQIQQVQGNCCGENAKEALKWCKKLQCGGCRHCRGKFAPKIATKVRYDLPENNEHALAGGAKDENKAVGLANDGNGVETDWQEEQKGVKKEVKKEEGVKREMGENHRAVIEVIEAEESGDSEEKDRNENEGTEDRNELSETEEWIEKRAENGQNEQFPEAEEPLLVGENTEMEEVVDDVIHSARGDLVEKEIGEEGRGGGNDTAMDEGEVVNANAAIFVDAVVYAVDAGRDVDKQVSHDNGVVSDEEEINAESLGDMYFGTDISSESENETIDRFGTNNQSEKAPLNFQNNITSNKNENAAEITAGGGGGVGNHGEVFVGQVFDLWPAEMSGGMFSHHESLQEWLDWLNGGGEAVAGESGVAGKRRIDYRRPGGLRDKLDDGLHADSSSYNQARVSVKKLILKEKMKDFEAQVEEEEMEMWQKEMDNQRFMSAILEFNTEYNLALTECYGQIPEDNRSQHERATLERATLGSLGGVPSRQTTKELEMERVELKELFKQDQSGEAKTDGKGGDDDGYENDEGMDFLDDSGRRDRTVLSKLAEAGGNAEAGKGSLPEPEAMTSSVVTRGPVNERKESEEKPPKPPAERPEHKSSISKLKSDMKETIAGNDFEAIQERFIARKGRRCKFSIDGVTVCEKYCGSGGCEHCNEKTNAEGATNERAGNVNVNHSASIKYTRRGFEYDFSPTTTETESTPSLASQITMDTSEFEEEYEVLERQRDLDRFAGSRESSASPSRRNPVVRPLSIRWE